MQIPKELLDIIAGYNNTLINHSILIKGKYKDLNVGRYQFNTYTNRNVIISNTELLDDVLSNWPLEIRKRRFRKKEDKLKSKLEKILVYDCITTTEIHFGFRVDVRRKMACIKTINVVDGIGTVQCNDNLDYEETFFYPEQIDKIIFIRTRTNISTQNVALAGCYFYDKFGLVIDELIPLAKRRKSK